MCASTVHSPSPFPPPSPPPPGHQSSCTASTDRCCPLGEEPEAERDCGEHWCLCLPRLPPRSGPGSHCFSHRCGVCLCVCVYVCVVCDVCLSVCLMPSVGPGKVKFSQSFATALFSFLYHLSSYQYSEWGRGTHPLPVYAHPSPRPTPHVWRV